MIRKCKKCDWLTANDTYSICHACGGDLQKFDIAFPKLCLTKHSLDAGDSAASQALSPLSDESTPEVNLAATQRK